MAGSIRFAVSIDRSSINAIALVWVIAAGVVLAAALLLPFGAFLAISIFAVLVAEAHTLFHRVPVRTRAGGPMDVTSAADGRVLAVETVREDKFLKTECIRISVFMSIWDMHANFWPVSGTVTFTDHEDGRHVLAKKPKSSEENEHSCICVHTATGHDVLFKQIAGGTARRISTYCSVGDEVEAGKQCGIIKFGSRMELYLPVGSKVFVTPGEHIRSCTTVVGRLPEL